MSEHTVYERLDDAGTVVERVQPNPGSYEDTRLGCAALEGAGGWRVADPPVSAPAAEPGPPAEEPEDPPAPKRTRGGERGTQPRR